MSLQPNRKIVILDIDGVLNTHRSLASMLPHEAYDHMAPMANSGWTEEKVPVPRWGDHTGGRMVNTLCVQTGARIVVSSRWLFIVGAPVTKEWLVSKSEIDQTLLHSDWRVDYEIVRPGCPENLMKQEAILGWLERHPEVQQFVLLDDEPQFLKAFGKRTVRCTEADGIGHKGFLKALQLLGRA